MSGQPHPKPQKRKRKQIRIVDSLATTRACLTWRTCACCHAPSATGHHVIARGSPHFGDDVLENIVAVCGSGTTGCHGLIENADLQARAALGAFLVAERPEVLAYISGKLTPGYAAWWLQRHLYVRAPQAVA